MDAHNLALPVALLIIFTFVWMLPRRSGALSLPDEETFDDYIFKYWQDDEAYPEELL